CCPCASPGSCRDGARRGGITVRARAERVADGPTMLIEVIDTGIGIPPEVLPRLFERFQQADASTTRRFGGTGLGLAIVKRITELMHGAVGARSQQGKGSTFWVRLPLRESAPAKPMMADDASGDLNLSGLKVLVAEDNAVNRLVAGAMLEHLGIEVHFAENGVEAVSTVTAERPDLVLMDCHMPEMDGFDATVAIRAHERSLGQLPVMIVALTASVAGEEEARCRKSGMDGFLAKPLQVPQLVQVLRRVRDRALAGDAL
ncbi:MAG: response regulator, partial [Bryobacterales bacterium]|nr:response regulator [Bryobacterales bacterium]